MIKTILLTRPNHYNENDKKFFQKLGYQCLEIPLISIRPRELTLDQQTRIKQAQWLIFTSQAAIWPMLPFIQSHSRIATIGQKTAEQLQQLGFKVDFISEIENKEAMLSQWLKLQPQGPVVYGKSQLADNYISQQLSQYRIPCDELIVYDNLLDNDNQEILKNLLATQQLDAVYFASPSAWQRFYSIYKIRPFHLTFIALGTTTQQAIAKDGYTSILKKDVKKF